MDYIREFDIRLEKESFYAGETLNGLVVLQTLENFKLRAIRVLLRGKAHTEWKVMVSGERRTVKDDQYFMDDRAVIWGKEKAESSIPILPRGMHQFPFRFQLPESSLPCSFESKAGTIRYYLKVTLDLPYQSPPQGMKYFTIIGPHIDCMDHLRPIRGETKRRRCCLCCESGKVSLRTDFERSAYVCGESLRVRADIDNQSEEEVRLKLRLVQYIEYYIDRGVLGVSKELSHTILEYRGAPVNPRTRTKWDSQQNLVVPTMPPTLVGVCRLIQIYYVLKVNVELEKSGEDLHMHFPITIATVPFRIPNSNQTPVINYEVACEHCEGGMYIGPEFLLGQVYDGTSEFCESIVLYRPVYPTVRSNKGTMMLNNMGGSVNNSIQSQPQSSAASTPNATKGLKVDVPKDIQPQIHQPKPGASATNGKDRSSSSATSNSNLITTTVTQNASQSVDDKSLGKDPCCSNSVLAASSAGKSEKVSGSTGESSSKLKTSSKSDDVTVKSSSDCSEDPKPSQKSTSSTSSAVHVSFEAITGADGESASSKHSKPSSTSSGIGKMDEKTKDILTSGGESAAIDVDVKNVSTKIVEDETVGKTNAVFPGKVVRLEASNTGASDT